MNNSTMTQAQAVRYNELVSRALRALEVATPCHSLHCRHYDLANGRVCTVEAQRLLANAQRYEADCVDAYSQATDIVAAGYIAPEALEALAAFLPTFFAAHPEGWDYRMVALAFIEKSNRDAQDAAELAVRS